MSGGAWEYVAAYVNNGNSSLTTNGEVLINAADRYKNIYNVGNSDESTENYTVATPINGYYGDAVYETSSSVNSPFTNSWYNGYSYFPYTAFTFFIRGGSYATSSNGEAFALAGEYGTIIEYDSFRLVIPVLQ